MEFIEKTLDSKTVYDGKIIKVLKDDVELSNGQTSIREVVKHSGGVVILALRDECEECKVLMVKQYRYPAAKALLELPAGKLEPGEDPLEAAKRELREESGCVAKNWQSLGFIYTSTGYSDEKLYLYKASDLEFVGECPDENEILQDCEFYLKDIITKIKIGEINDAKTICALARGCCFE